MTIGLVNYILSVSIVPQPLSSYPGIRRETGGKGDEGGTGCVGVGSITSCSPFSAQTLYRTYSTFRLGI